jgi:predicted site-specific integrase-resolvase
MSKKLYSLKEAAIRLGISSITLRRWLIDKKVDEVMRNRNGWRVFSESDIERIRKYKDKLVRPVE